MNSPDCWFTHSLSFWSIAPDRLSHAPLDDHRAIANHQLADWLTEARSMPRMPVPGHRILINPECDWLDPSVPIEFLADLLRSIRHFPYFNFLLVTRMPHLWQQRLRSIQDLRSHAAAAIAGEWLDGLAPVNIWIGTTIRTREEADAQIPMLLPIPAHVHFLHVEPRENIDLLFHDSVGAIEDTEWLGRSPHQINWLVTEADTSPLAQPAHPDWFRSFLDTARRRNVPFWHQRNSRWVVLDDGARACRVCGCTERHACTPPCSWAGPDLCSACVGKPIPKGDRPVKFALNYGIDTGRMIHGLTHNALPG